MKAIRCLTYGPPGGLVIQDVPPPTPGPGQVVAEVRAAAINFPDVLMVEGRYQVAAPLPFTPGSEFAGRVVGVGEGVTAFTIGDAVMGSSGPGMGCFAEQVAAPTSRLRSVPSGLAWSEAAAMNVTYRTAVHALVTIGKLAPGEWVAVLGASGGVGSATVDVAHRLGAQIVACASTRGRVDVCLARGADAGIVYDKEDLKARLKEITGGGADVVVDPVGGDYSELALRATRRGARFVSVGFAAGDIPRIPLNLVLLKGVAVHGFELRTLHQYIPERVAETEEVLDGLVRDGLRPLVSRIVTLEDVPGALGDVAARRAHGKVVVDFGQGTEHPTDER